MRIFLHKRAKRETIIDRINKEVSIAMNTGVYFIGGVIVLILFYTFI